MSKSIPYEALLNILICLALLADEHGHLKIYLPKKLLECLPKCTSLPKERHRWNTNEVRNLLLIISPSTKSVSLQRYQSGRWAVHAGPFSDRFVSRVNSLLISLSVRLLTQKEKKKLSALLPSSKCVNMSCVWIYYRLKQGIPPQITGITNVIIRLHILKLPIDLPLHYIIHTHIDIIMYFCLHAFT